MSLWSKTAVLLSLSLASSSSLWAASDAEFRANIRGQLRATSAEQASYRNTSWSVGQLFVNEKAVKEIKKEAKDSGNPSQYLDQLFGAYIQVTLDEFKEKGTNIVFDDRMSSFDKAAKLFSITKGEPIPKRNNNIKQDIEVHIRMDVQQAKKTYDLLGSKVAKDLYKGTSVWPALQNEINGNSNNEVAEDEENPKVVYEAEFPADKSAAEMFDELRPRAREIAENSGAITGTTLILETDAQGHQVVKGLIRTLDPNKPVKLEKDSQVLISGMAFEDDEFRLSNAELSPMKIVESPDEISEEDRSKMRSIFIESSEFLEVMGEIHELRESRTPAFNTGASLLSFADEDLDFELIPHVCPVGVKI